MATKHLTDHLLALSTLSSSFTRATQHPFLTAAGNGSLPTSILTKWLVQDIHYTRAYIRFIGGLLSQLYIPTSLFKSASVPAQSHSKQARKGDNEDDTYSAARQKDLQARIFDVLTSALTNIQRETQFFEDVAEEYGLSLDLTAEPEPITRAYMSMFDSMRQGSGRGGLLEGLTVLWATEICYNQAWTHAKRQMQNAGGQNEGSPGSKEDERAMLALHAAFIPNWTSPDFEAFVDEIKGVLDAAAEEEGLMESGRQGSGSHSESNGKIMLKRCERAWEQVLWLEESFWPDV